MHMDVVLTHHSFQNLHIFTITDLNKQIATSYLDVPF